MTLTLIPVLGPLPFAEEGGFHPPDVDEEFFPPALLFDGTIFELNRILIIRLLAVAALLLLFWLGLRRAKVVPGKWQSLVELMMNFVRENVVFDLLGERIGRIYLPFVSAIFFGVLAMNLTGVIPGLNISANALIGMPATLAVLAYVLFIYAGIREKGALAFFRDSLFPAGVPKLLYILLTPIEFVNVFVVRPVSLALRLFLNMLVGHLLLALAFSATWALVGLMSVLSALGVLTFAGGLLVTMIELLVAVLQAYVFAILTTSFIQLAVAKSH